MSTIALVKNYTCERFFFSLIDSKRKQMYIVCKQVIVILHDVICCHNYCKTICNQDVDIRRIVFWQVCQHLKMNNRNHCTQRLLALKRLSRVFKFCRTNYAVAMATCLVMELCDNLFATPKNEPSIKR